MRNLLYGTHLTFRVKEILDAKQQPMTVKQITEELAVLPEREHYNLSRRVRKSLHLLVFEQEVSLSTKRRKNLILFTYQINAHESTGKTEESDQKGQSRKHDDDDAGAISSTT